MQIIKFERSCGDAVTEIKSSADFSKDPIGFDDDEFWENYDEKTFVEFNEHPETSFIRYVQWEAECNPYGKEGEGFMRVGNIELME